MGLGLGLGIWWPIQTSIIPGILRPLKARATYFENVRCTTATLQKIENIQYTAPALPVGLLASYPGASAAYSLRNLIDTTTNVVRVRRSSDNAEQNFIATQITDGTLTTFTGANDGFVTTWYDQSGNSNNAAQATASNQPKLVSSGVVELENGKPCLNYDTSGNDSFDLATPISNARTVFQVLRRNDSSGIVNFLGAANKFDYHAGSGTLLSNQYASASVRDGANYVNSVLKNFTTTNRPTTQALFSMISVSSTNTVGRIAKDRNVGRSWQGTMQEVILYNIDQTSNRTVIETNINNEYNVYPTQGLLYDYSGASAAYSLRNLANNVTDVVRVRRSSDNVEQNFTATQITDGTLTTFTGANDGYVTRWYDQSGNSNNASQTAAANQPKLVSSGVVELSNNKPSLRFKEGASNRYLNQPLTYQLSSSFSVLSVVQGETASASYEGILATNTMMQLARAGGENWGTYPNGITNTNLYTSTINLITMISSNGNTGDFYTNSNSDGSFTNTVGQSRRAIGGESTQEFNGYISEMIIYPSDQSSNRTGIETNINTEYTIY